MTRSFTVHLLSIIAPLAILASHNWVTAQSLPAGVVDVAVQLTIRRQQPGLKVPAPWQASQPSSPAGSLAGSDQFATVLRFDPKVTGQLIKTEGYDEGHVGRWWNNNNTGGDTNLRSFLCGSVHDLTVDGQAGIANYPYISNSGPHGSDFPWRADGICSQGAGFTGERLRLYQVPGTGIILKNGGGTQSGALGIYDQQATRLDQVWVSHCMNGINCAVADSRLSHLQIVDVAKDGLMLSGPGTYVDDCHVYGGIGRLS